MSDLHSESISVAQRELLEKLGCLNEGVLVGGTALSLQIGHRKSYDLDFVRIEEITDNLLKKIKSIAGSAQLVQRLSSPTQYTAFIDDVKITFFQDEAAFLHEEKQYPQFALADVKDIFSSKLYVMGKRATWRDYVDVAVCLDQGLCSLSQGIKEAVLRYQVNERWILDPLTYFDDLEMTPVEWLRKEYSDQKIKEILVSKVDEYLLSLK